jgi:hypothetical protein
MFLEPAEIVREETARELIAITTDRLVYFQVMEKKSLGKIASSEHGKWMRKFLKEHIK